jgi:transcriptional regulator with XRE-family HTH domain
MESAANDPVTRVGMRIRELRLALGLSQKQVGSALRITPQAVQKYETAHIQMTVARLFELADVLGVSPAFLVEGPRKDEPEARAGNNLREFRERSGLTQSALAEMVETSGQNISLLERGLSKLTVEMLVRLGRAFGCHPWALVDPQFVDEPPGPARRIPKSDLGRRPTHQIRHTEPSNAD